MSTASRACARENISKADTNALAKRAGGLKAWAKERHEEWLRRIQLQRGSATGPETPKDEGVSPLIAEACAGIDELIEATATGDSHEGLYTIRTRKLELKPGSYGPDGVRAVRIKLALRV